jgi:hypothetical protein
MEEGRFSKKNGVDEKLGITITSGCAVICK